MERTYKARGYVLRTHPLGDADRILVLFTYEHGKVNAVAKGARRARSSLGGRLEFGSELTLGLHRGRSLDVVTSADLRRSDWSGIVRPEAFATAQLFAELVDLFCEPELALPDVYGLLDGAIRAAAGDREPGRLVPRFELRLLGALGIAPAADRCVRCGATLSDAAAWADLDAGGLACERCRPHRAEAFALASADAENFRALAAPPRGERSARYATTAAAKAIDGFVTYHLGKR
ncbi:MAG: DNA repair protein RecO, partial [Candidatus Dormibacteria bacterium]